MTYIKNRCFTTKDGNNYEVIATDYGTSKFAIDAIDTIRNSKGEKVKMKRSKTLEFIKS